MVFGQNILVLGDTITCENTFTDKTDEEGNFYSFINLINSKESGDTSFYYKYQKDSTLIWEKKINPDSVTNKDYSVSVGSGSVLAYTDSTGKQIYLTSYSENGELNWSINSQIIENGKVHALDVHAGAQGDVYLAICQSGGLSIDTLTIPNSDTANGQRHILISFTEDGHAQWYRSTSTLCKDSLWKGDIQLFSDKNGQVYLSGAFTENFSLAKIQVINQAVNSNHYLSSFNNRGFMTYLTKTGNTRNSSKDASFEGVCRIEGSDVYLKYAYNGGKPDSTYSVLGKDIIFDGSHIIKITPPTQSAEVLYRLNCGGETIENPWTNWLEDRQLQPTPYLDFESSNHTTGTIDQWNSPNQTSAPDNVFGNNRYDRPYGGDLKYHFPLDPGTHFINLYFAEKPNIPGVSGIGERVFDVLFNGDVVIKDLDIYQEAGLKALQIPVLYTNLSDSLTISFNRKIYDPQINGIEIIANYPANLKNFPLSVSEKEVGNKGKILITNPFSRHIQIFSKEDIGKTTISLHTLDGRLLLSRETIIRKEKEIKIPAEPNWETGLYIIRINERAFPIFKGH